MITPPNHPDLVFEYTDTNGTLLRVEPFDDGVTIALYRDGNWHQVYLTDYKALALAGHLNALANLPKDERK